jgi:PAT family beta-lactamase induction signal transducer AmpG
LIAPAGAIAKQVGWPLFFVLSFLASFPGLALLPIFALWDGKDLATDDGDDNDSGDKIWADL